MREAIGGLSLFQIVILFILLFTGIMCLTINESKAYAVKDEIVTIIQNAPLTSKLELSDQTLEDISKKLQEAGYRTTGKCPSDEWLAYNRDGDIGDKNNASFCVKINNVADAFVEDIRNKCDNGKCNINGNDFPNMVYYDIVLFYKLDIPVLKYFLGFKVYSSTKVLYS